MPEILAYCETHRRTGSAGSLEVTTFFANTLRLFGCEIDDSPLEVMAKRVFHPFYGLMRGEPWFMRNHMVFVQNQFLGLSFTSENMAELMK
ncbi:MAG: hypothetical protein WBI14_07800, partial [Anaerolineaceae bacterium]